MLQYVNATFGIFLVPLRLTGDSLTDKVPFNMNDNS